MLNSCNLNSCFAQRKDFLVGGGKSGFNFLVVVAVVLLAVAQFEGKGVMPHY